MLKKVFAASAAVLLSGAIAFGANLPLLTGPQPAGDIVSIINNLIRSINTGVSGLISAQTAAVSTTATTAEETLQQYTLPANTLSTAGQGVLVNCWGTTAANANNKTRKLYFGSSSIATATEGANNQKWFLTARVMRKTATTQGVLMTGQAGTSSVTPLAPTTADGSETLTGNVLIKCTGTNGTASASDITANGMTVEIIK